MFEWRLRTLPKPNELWLSRPPYLLLARIVEVEEDVDEGGLVSYVLYDEGGWALERVEGVPLDADFWHTFQPLTPRQG